MNDDDKPADELPANVLCQITFSVTASGLVNAEVQNPGKDPRVNPLFLLGLIEEGREALRRKWAMAAAAKAQQRPGILLGHAGMKMQ